VRLAKFTAPWLLYRLVWVPTTRKVLRILVTRYQYSACEASSKLAYINLTVCCLVLLLTLLYNDQLPLINDLLACWSVE